MTINIQSYKPLKSAGSVKAFYDDIIYWEIAKNSNKFYVTFMKGEYAVPNNKQESIGTMEIGFPHTALGNGSTGSFSTGFNRVNALPKTFLQNIESSSVGLSVLNSHNYNGFIPITELQGTRHYKTTITASLTRNTYQYEIKDSSLGSTIVTREIDAAYFYPFSSHQLSVLRDEPTLIVNMDKESELNDGLGDAGFVVIPQNCHPKVKNNVEYYLEKAGLIDKTTKFKNPSTRR
tara:strand:- start:3473 stop:4174 length:702 start_codon:yes stop_codon:yes gene_type:complete